MKKKTVSVLFWNVWFDNLMNGSSRFRALSKQLNLIIEKHQPDIIALNEVLRRDGEELPSLLTRLKKSGYKSTEFAEASPLDKRWNVGVAFASKIKPIDIEKPIVGYDISAHHKGYEGYEVEFIQVQFQEFDFIVVHLPNITPRKLGIHFTHQQNLANHLKLEDFENLIMVGDFNEPRKMPFAFSWRYRSKFENRTGRFVKPTWRHRNNGVIPFRSNLDKVFWTRNSRLKLEEFEVLDGKVSDHQPIFATFTVDQEKA